MKAESPAGVAGCSFALNVFPAQFSSDTLAVFAGSYGSDAAFAQLTAAKDGWTAWRDTADGSRVYVWRHHELAAFSRPAFRPATVKLAESPPLFCQVMLDGIDRHLRERGFVRLGRDAYVNWAVGNMLARLNVAGFTLDTRVGIFPKIVVRSFITRFGQQEPPLLGIIVEVAHTTRLDVPLDEVIAKGLDVRGRYVKLRKGVGGPEDCGGLVIGRVSGVERGELSLDDLRDPALKRVPAPWCVLEPGRRTLEDYLRQVHPRQYRELQTQLAVEFARFISPQEKLRLSEVFVAQRLVGPNGAPLALAPGLTVSFGKAASPAAGASTFPARELLPPVYSFDPESPKTAGVADEGLKWYGPYSQARLRGQVPHVLVLAPESFRGQVEQFVADFRDGIRGYEATFNGFQRKYRLSGLEIVDRYFSWSSAPALDAYYNAAVAALDESTDYDFCFVVVREDFKRLAPAQNPYYVCKALLLSFGITVQDLRIETLRLPEASFQYSLNTIALASYAKLGGSPFVLKARQLRHHELIIGIGRSIERPPGSRLGAAKQIIGFTTVFRSDGDYLLNACTPYTDFANYEQRLEEVILKSVTEVAANEGIADGETVRLIFHVYKQTGRREVQAIRNAVAKLTRYQVEFALLHINDSHEFRLFDRTNPGTRDRAGRLDGLTALIPPRQLMVEIGPRERLINFIGPRQYRRRGTPTPLRITLDRASTYVDLDTLAQQVYEFAGLSWRSFNPGVQPITVFYSELMAGLNSRLRQVSAWNQELVRTKLKRRLWFI